MEGPIFTLIQREVCILIFVFSDAKREDKRYLTDWQKASE